MNQINFFYSHSEVGIYRLMRADPYGKIACLKENFHMPLMAYVWDYQYPENKRCLHKWVITGEFPQLTDKQAEALMQANPFFDRQWEISLDYYPILIGIAPDLQKVLIRLLVEQTKASKRPVIYRQGLKRASFNVNLGHYTHEGSTDDLKPHIRYEDGQWVLHDVFVDPERVGPMVKRSVPTEDSLRVKDTVITEPQLKAYLLKHWTSFAQTKNSIQIPLVQTR